MTFATCEADIQSEFTVLEPGDLEFYSGLDDESAIVDSCLELHGVFPGTDVWSAALALAATRRRTLAPRSALAASPMPARTLVGATGFDVGNQCTAEFANAHAPLACIDSTSYPDVTNANTSLGNNIAAADGFYPPNGNGATSGLGGVAHGVGYGISPLRPAALLAPPLQAPTSWNASPCTLDIGGADVSDHGTAAIFSECTPAFASTGTTISHQSTAAFANARTLLACCPLNGSGTAHEPNGAFSDLAGGAVAVSARGVGHEPNQIQLQGPAMLTSAVARAPTPCEAGEGRDAAPPLDVAADDPPLLGISARRAFRPPRRAAVVQDVCTDVVQPATSELSMLGESSRRQFKKPRAAGAHTSSVYQQGLPTPAVATPSRAGGNFCIARN